MGNAASDDSNARASDRPPDSGNDITTAEASKVNSSSDNIVFGTPLTNKKKADSHPPLVITTPTTNPSLNGHTPVFGGTPFNYSTHNMFSPSSSDGRSSPHGSASLRRRTAAGMIPRSKLGMMPKVKYTPSASLSRQPARGSVWVPPPDRISSPPSLNAFSSPGKSRQPRSREEVITELRKKSEKRKHADTTASRQCEQETSTGISSSSPGNLIDSKRRRHNTSEVTSRETVSKEEFVQPSPVTVGSKDSERNDSESSGGPRSVTGISPKQDGHLRTAIASSYSSSRRMSSKRRYQHDVSDEPLYKRSINLNFVSSSRDSSRRGSPAPIDRDSESETGSRISVTPLPSLKNSPRSSPLPTQRYMNDSPMPSSTLLTPKVEVKAAHPVIAKPSTGFVATLEDRAFDEDINKRRAKKLLGVVDEPVKPAPQIVMPIVKPDITIPDKKSLKPPQTEDVSAGSTINTPQQVSAGDSHIGPQQAEKTIAEKNAETSSSENSETQPPPSYNLAAATSKGAAVGVAAEPVKSATASNVSFSLPAATTSVSAAGPAAAEPKISLSFGRASAGAPPTEAKDSTEQTAESTASALPSAGFSFSSSNSSSAAPSLFSLTPTKPSVTSAPATSLTLGGSTSTTAANSVANPVFSFGAQKDSGTAFGTPSSASSAPATTATQAAPTSGFGAPAASASPATFSFGKVESSAATGDTTSTTTSAPVFGFGATSSSAAPAAFSFGKSKASAGPVPSAGFTFGAPSVSQSTSAAPAFGAPSVSQSASAAPAFGAPSVSQAKSAASAFGAPSVSQAASTAPAFGAPSVSQPASAPAFTFGQPSTSDKSAAVSSAAPKPVFSFGAKPSTSDSSRSSPFGAATGSIFGASSAAPTSSTSSPFGAVTTSASGGSIFGGSMTSSNNSIFGGTAATSTSGSSIFGGSAATTSSSMFGGLAAATTTSSVFGAGAPFGAAASNAPAFGRGLTSAASQPSLAAFGASTSASVTNLFGSASTPSFGTATTTSASTGFTFGQSISSSSASAKPAFNFGGAANPPAFGASSSTAAPAFGAATNGNGPTNPFGAASTGFGSSNSTTSTPAFGASTAQPSPFGAAPPAFGAQASVADPPKPNFNFGATTAPAFGASSAVPQFGTSAPPGGASGGAMFSLGTSKPAPRRRTRR